jgi:hypothetical protein
VTGGNDVGGDSTKVSLSGLTARAASAIVSVSIAMSLV